VIHIIDAVEAEDGSAQICHEAVHFLKGSWVASWFDG